MSFYSNSKYSKTSEILSDIYDARINSRFNSNVCAIKSKPICGNVRYLDDEIANKSIKNTKFNLDNETDLDFDLMGGAKKSKTKKIRSRNAVDDETPIYPSLNDIPDKEIQEFIQETHIQYITANMKSNSVYVVPDKEAMKEIKKDIKNSLGSIKEDSPEAILKIKSDTNLIYRAFIMDIFGSLPENGGFEYRLPTTYPDEFKPETIIRRTSRLEDKCFFIQLTKKGCKISCNSDMKNAISLDFVNIVGRKPTFISFVFKGNLIPLIKNEKELKGGKQNKKSKKTVIKRFMELVHSNPYDIDSGMYQFVGEMIENFGLEECRKHYSADFLQTAFSLINNIGKSKVLTNYGNDVYNQHMKMNKKYKPKNRNGCNKQNKNKLITYSKKFLENMNAYLIDSRFIEKSKTCDSKKYLNSLLNCYKAISPDLSDDEVKNTIGEDIAYGIYENTNNMDLAINTMQNVIDSLNNKNNVNKFYLEGILNSSEKFLFHKFSAQEFYPMLNSNYSVNKYCKCGKKNCPFCGKLEKSKMKGGGIYDDEEVFQNALEMEIPEIPEMPEMSNEKEDKLPEKSTEPAEPSKNIEKTEKLTEKTEELSESSESHESTNPTETKTIEPDKQNFKQKNVYSLIDQM